MHECNYSCCNLICMRVLFFDMFPCMLRTTTKGNIRDWNPLQIHHPYCRSISAELKGHTFIKLPALPSIPPNTPNSLPCTRPPVHTCTHPPVCHYRSSIRPSINSSIRLSIYSYIHPSVQL